MATNNSLNLNASNPLPSSEGGTGVSNSGTWTNGGNIAFSGAHTFTGTLSADTAVTFPTSGTLATTGGTVANATNVAVTNDNATSSTVYPAWVSANTGNLPIKVSDGTLKFIPSLGASFATNFISSVTSTVSSGSTIVLTSASNRVQRITGSTAQTIQLPAANTLSVAWEFEINNNTNQTATINDGSGSLLLTIAAGAYAYIFCISSSTVAGAWDYHFALPSTAVYGTAGLKVTGTLAAGSSGTQFTVDSSGNVKTPSILDSNGNAVVTFSATASAVNSINMSNQSTTVPPGIAAIGSDTNIGLNLYTKGTGQLNIVTGALTTPITIASGTSGQHQSQFVFANTSATDTYTFPDGSGTLLMTGVAINSVPSITFSSTSGVIGTTTNNNAAAGSVGEFVSSVIASGSPVSCANNTAQDMTSISLTAGDWDVWGNINFNMTGICTNIVGWSSSTTASAPDSSLFNGLQGTASAPIGGGTITTNQSFSIPSQRYSLSGTTTIYISSFTSFSTGAVVMNGAIYARRVR